MEKLDGMLVSGMVGRILQIHFAPLGGDEINRFKNNIKNFCLTFNCTATFEHNEREFICDKEGNVAQTN